MPFGARTAALADLVSGADGTALATQEQLAALEAAAPLLWLPTSNLTIVGTELTQSIQSFTFNGQGSSLPANSVQLIAEKTLILRVYVHRSNYLWLPQPASITGRVSYAGHPDLKPINGPITAMSSASINRGNPNHTLLFRIPASHCKGTVSFTVKVFEPAHADQAAWSSPPKSVTATFQSVPLVKVHGVLIRYTGPGGPIAAPNAVDLVNTLVGVVKVYPMSSFYYVECVEKEFSGDLTVGGGGGCGTGWNKLFNMIWNLRAASGTNDVFVGLLPPGVPTAGVIGCGGGGVAVGYKGDWSTMAQEIGHAFGRAHAPCGNPGGPDPNYPTYDSYPSGSIGEFGFDTTASAVFNPSSTFDFMSYCGPVWVSPYTYTGLKNGIVSSAAAAHPARPGMQREAGENLYLNFRIDRSGGVELLPSFHLAGPEHGVELGPMSPVGCELLGESDDVLVSHRCHFTNPHQDPDDPVLLMHEIVPWNPEVRSISFSRHGEVCHTIEVEKDPPEVHVEAVKHVDKRPELVRVEWLGSHPEGPLTYLLRFSNDGGTSWRPVAANLTETRQVVNLDLLPGGDRCVFQVIASSGIRTATAESKPLAVGRKPGKAYILAPASGTTVVEGDSVTLQGGGFSPDFGTTEFEDSFWTADGERVGVGQEIVLDSLPAGRHRIRLTVPDGLGGEESTSAWITVIPRE